MPSLEEILVYVGYFVVLYMLIVFKKPANKNQPVVEKNKSAS